MRYSVSYQQSTISYLRFGTGSERLFCFHGFGDRADIWLQLGSHWREKYTIIALDLPYHGQTVWHQNTFKQRDFDHIIREIMRIEGVETCGLAGFSWGARVVQSLVFTLENKINHIFLFAPDGFGTKGLSLVSLTPLLVRRFFQRMALYPKNVLAFFLKLHRSKLMSKESYNFLHRNIKNIKKRQRLFAYWLSMDDFTFKLSIFKQKLRETPISTDLFFAQHDHLVPLSNGVFLADKMPHIRLHIIEIGHNILTHSNIIEYDCN